MLLAIDAGNTNIVFGLFDGEGAKVRDWRCETQDFAGGEPLEGVSAAIIASVVPAVTEPLKAYCRSQLGLEPMVVGEGALDLGIDVLVDEPDEVGADRLVNTVAAQALYGGPLIVIDFGTATTFDVVDGAGNYTGGCIAPGINLSLEALHRAAAKLPLPQVAKPERVIGKATVPAMQSGLYWGYVGLIEGLVARISEEFGAPLEVVATGGLATLFARGTAVIGRLDLDLTLKGLYEIYRRNKDL